MSEAVILESQRSSPSAGVVPRLRSMAPYAMVGLLIVELVVFSFLAPDTFPTAVNFRAVAANQAILGLLTLALLVPLLAGEFDASLAAVLTVSTLVSASLMSNHDWPLWLAVTASLLLSTGIGVVNGLIVIKLGVNSLVATLGMFTVLTGMITGLAEGRTISAGLPTATLESLSRPVLGIPLPICYLLVVATIVWYVTERTPLGRHWQAIGSSIPSARLAGLKTDRLRLIAFGVGGLLAGIAGTVQLAKAQLGSPNIGPNLLFPALTSAFLGAAAFRLGSFNVRGSIVSIFLLAFGVVGLIMIGAPFWVDQVFTGSALLISLALVRLLRQDAR